MRVYICTRPCLRVRLLACLFARVFVSEHVCDFRVCVLGMCL
jgi:hypothetical protein